MKIKNFFLKSKTGTALQQITIKQLKSLLINIPPFSEQQRIVAKLDAAFAETNKIADIEFKKKETTKMKNERAGGVVVRDRSSRLDCLWCIQEDRKTYIIMTMLIIIIKQTHLFGHSQCGLRVIRF